MSGITIGNGAVIGAGTIVRRDIEAYEIYTGNPAHFYEPLRKYRFDKETIEKLLEIAWWDWPEERVLANAELLAQSNIDKFINEHI